MRRLFHFECFLYCTIKIRSDYFYRFPIRFICVSSRLKVFRWKVVPENLLTFTGKRMCGSLFKIKLQACSLQLSTKETLTNMFSCEFYEVFKNTFFKTTSVALSINSFSAKSNCYYFTQWIIHFSHSKAIFHQSC